jgi:acid phosphatase
MMTIRSLFVLMSALAVVSCSDSPSGHAPDKDLGLLWVKHAAEYEALSRQAYHQAERALPGFIANKSWTALPGQTNVENLPPAIIFDVDETVVSGVDFQLTFERPITQTKLNNWNSEGTARGVAGFARFANTARSAGVELYFITNRPCELIDGDDDPCPYKTTVLNDIREAGFETDLDHIMLANERPSWTKEKSYRRELIAHTHRIIMLIGDDLSDFIPCMRAVPAVPCEVAATADSRREKVTRYAGYWGNGWYILPNPMHGSWTSIR